MIINRSFVRRKSSSLYGLYLKLSQKKVDQSLIGEKLKFGEKNSDKTFLIIKINNSGLGLMAIYNCVLGYLRVAQNNGFIPVIDLKNYKNGYLEKDELGKVNAWEYYFEQPTRFSLDEVYQSANVIMATGLSPREASPIPLNYYYLTNPKVRANKYYSIIRESIKIKPEISEIIDENYKKLLEGKRVIGVVNRGSDMINAKGHQIQPDIQEVINKTKEMLLKWNCQYVFLATEEVRTLEIFKQAFGDQLLFNKSERVKTYEKGIPFTDVTFGRENEKFKKGLEYLTTVVLLSKCNCLIGSLVGATAGALGLNMGSYENTHIFDLGEYK
jgi:hypothetical protein